MDLRGHLDLLILATLQRLGQAHGYAVIAALREHSAGVFDLPEGTVYPALHRLERDGQVASAWGEGGVRRRRVYQLTPDGHAALADKRGAWDSFASGMSRILGAARTSRPAVAQ